MLAYSRGVFMARCGFLLLVLSFNLYAGSLTKQQVAQLQNLFTEINRIIDGANRQYVVQHIDFFELFSPMSISKEQQVPVWQQCWGNYFEFTKHIDLEHYKNWRSCVGYAVKDEYLSAEKKKWLGKFKRIVR